MLPRHALSRALASRTWRATRKLSTTAWNSSAPAARISRTTSSLHPPAPSTKPSIVKSYDTDLRNIFDQPFSDTAASTSSALQPTGLFGDPLLQSPRDFISLANATIRKAKAIVARITNAPYAGPAEMRMVVQNFDRLSDVLCGVIDTAELVRHGHPDPNWINCANEAYELLCSYMNVLNTHPALYEVGQR